MIYTCYEMVRDCRAGLPEGWIHFISHYVPVCRQTLAHYAPEKAGDAALLDHILLAVRQPESFIFQATEPPGSRNPSRSGNADGGAGTADHDREASHLV